MFNIFLDDIRTPDMIYPDWQNYRFVILRSYRDFVDHVEVFGLPNFISFDNDLGLDIFTGEVAKDGYSCAKWLVNESGFDLADLKYYVHSANPVAADQIRSLLNNYIREHRRIKRLP